ncbi:hypothetical protein L5515_013962 [Caenorhabditis briggsae]|uniref:Uncharacterized protein n=1 Tax=Caenorhabditis briggsae TaxID=6238 RepID=A0AAE9EAR7_CAEBR|nr:hypothetical protein L5515_013962 [Caenorhabditis briggsae]
MASDNLESTFEIVSKSEVVMNRKMAIEVLREMTKEELLKEDALESIANNKETETATKLAALKKAYDGLKRGRMARQKSMLEAALFTTVISFLIINTFSDLLFFLSDIQEGCVKRGSQTDEDFKMSVAEFTANIKTSGRLNRPIGNFDNAALYYLLSEKQPIEIAFRRQWIPDHEFFEAVEKFVRGMEWENTLEEELFVRGVPNFDRKFQLEEMTLRTIYNHKIYNQKFLNLGTKEMIDKNHSIEYFTSQRTLIRLEKKNGNEVSRTEYFLKLGDLHIFDKRGEFECTRVFYAPTIDKEIKKRMH